MIVNIGVADPDSHHFGRRIRIRIRVKIRIRIWIRIKLRSESQSKFRSCWGSKNRAMEDRALSKGSLGGSVCHWCRFASLWRGAGSGFGSPSNSIKVKSRKEIRNNVMLISNTGQHVRLLRRVFIRRFWVNRPKYRRKKRRIFCSIWTLRGQPEKNYCLMLWM